MTYEMDVAGLKRELPLCRVTDDLYIGAFVMFGDVELTVHCAAELLKRAPEYDYLIAPEAKAIPLLYEMARQSGAEKYFIARKGAKAYMSGVFEVEVRSITTMHIQKLVIDKADAEMINGKRILILDDVISTGESTRWKSWSSAPAASLPARWPSSPRATPTTGPTSSLWASSRSSTRTGPRRNNPRQQDTRPGPGRVSFKLRTYPRRASSPAQPGEKLRQQGRALLAQHAPVDGGPVAVALLEEVYNAADRAAVGLPGPVHHRGKARVYYRAGAHRAGLKGDKQRAAAEVPRPQRGAGGADGLHLGVGGGVRELLPAVATAPDYNSVR